MSIWIRWEGAALGTKKIEGKNDKTGGPGIWLCVCILCLVSLSQQGFLAGGPDASGIAHTCPIRAVKLRRVWGRGGGQEEKEIHGGPRRRRAERVFPLESSHRSSGKKRHTPAEVPNHQTRPGQTSLSSLSGRSFAPFPLYFHCDCGLVASSGDCRAERGQPPQ